MNIYQLLAAAMDDVGAVRKGERNSSQGFNFRGIDSVVNAVSPAFRKHGIIVFPTLMEQSYETVEVGKNRSMMGHCRVKVAYTFVAPDGTSLIATVAAESMDSGDKATAKAMSVAFRTALLQTLCLPTDDLDPDAESFERATAPAPAVLGSAASRGPARPPMAGSAAPRQSGPSGNPLSSSQRIVLEKTLARKNMTLEQAGRAMGMGDLTWETLTRDQFVTLLGVLPEEEGEA